MKNSRRLSIAFVLSCLFVIGFALMGFEMLGSRYLNPYFGGGITTWASLISVVLLAMMLGYYGGGFVVDSFPGLGVLIISVLTAGISLIFVPVFADDLIISIMTTFGDGFWGVLLASFFLSFIPVGLLSACSPYVVRLLLIDLKAGGKTTGLVYAVSTFGNVAGTLATTFYLIPSFGTRAITSAFGMILIALAILIFSLRHHITRGLISKGITPALLALVSLPLIVAPHGPAEAASRENINPLAQVSAFYPEGPLWQDGDLYYAEMQKNRVMRLRGGNAATFWREEGCGPTSLARYKSADFIILCHLAAKLVQVNATGEILSEMKLTPSGQRFMDPNDCHSDGAGGVFFTDPGPFSSPSSANGTVYHLAPDGRLTVIARDLKYANGIAYDVNTRTLLVSEHLARKVWEYTLDDRMKVVSARVFLDIASLLTPEALVNPLIGPDGIEFTHNGSAVIAIYGAGLLVIVSASGQIRQLETGIRYVTNIASNGSNIAVVGSFTNNRPLNQGRVQIFDLQTIESARNGHVLSVTK